MSQMDSRYEIGCDCCHVVSYCLTKAEAIRRADEHLSQHKTDGCKREVCVYDRLGRADKKFVYRNSIDAPALPK